MAVDGYLNFDTRINQKGFIKGLADIGKGVAGFATTVTSLINRVPERDDCEVYSLEATNMAEEEGLKGLANIVLVGKMLKETGFCSYETIEAAIRKTVPPRKAALIDKNLQALKLGMEN